MLVHEQVDRGAIKHVISNANIMCPGWHDRSPLPRIHTAAAGLTSPGARMTPAPAGVAVAVMAEAKVHALAVGLTKLSSEEMCAPASKRAAADRVAARR